MKLVGALLIVAGFSSWGYAKAYGFMARLRRLQAIYRSLELLETQMDYALMSIPDCFEKIGQDSTKPYIKNFYETMAAQLRKRGDETFGMIWKIHVAQILKEDVLTGADCDLINVVGDMPLYLNKEIRITILHSVMVQLLQLIHHLEQEESSKCKIYQISGLSVGILFVLLLI